MTRRLTSFGVRLTASALDRTNRCPASACLPQARSTSDAAERGTKVHTFIEAVRNRATTLMLADAQLSYADALEQARAEKLADIAEGADHLALCEGFDFALIPQGAQLELALAWDPFTDVGRIIGASIERDYDRAAPGELVGTADVVGRVGSAVLVADWKTGHKITTAAWSLQLRFLALAAARQSGATSAIVAMVYLREDGRAYIDRAEFDDVDLHVIAADLRGLVQRVEATRLLVEAGKPINVQMGHHCGYCSAVPSCPAHARLITQLVKRTDGEAPEDQPTQVTAMVNALSPDAAGEAWIKWQRANAYLRLVGEALSIYVRQNGDVPLPGGTHALREVVRKTRRMDGEIAARVIKEKHPELVSLAVRQEPVVSQASIDKAVLATQPKLRGRGKVVEAIVAEIEREGGYPASLSAPIKVVTIGGAAVPEPLSPSEKSFQALR